MKIIHFEAAPRDQELLSSSLPKFPLLQPAETGYLPASLSEQTASQAAGAEVVSVFVNSVVDKAVIDALPALKLVVARSTGFDHIDVDYAKSKGIVVCNVPAYGSRTVAEFTFALILALSRKVFLAAQQVKLKHDWDFSAFEGFNLQGKTLGVVGTGRIGLNVIQIAKGFEVKIVAHDVFPNSGKASELGFEYASLERLLAESDIVTLHVPAVKDTHHLINRGNIRSFKPGALLINTSRGDVIDSEAILLGLEEGILSGVGLDVIEGEHELKEEAALLASDQMNQDKLKLLLEDHLLMDYPNVILTPHIAFNSREARREIIETALANIERFLAGQPQNAVNK